MLLNKFEQICKDYGLYVEINPVCKNVKGEYTYARAFYKNELVALYDNRYNRRIYCYTQPSTICYATEAMLIDNGESTEVYSASELEENIVKAVCNLKKLFIKIKKFEIEKEFE